jgi:hypothetical protein
MRLARSTLNEQDFANLLLDVGHGRNNDTDGTIVFDPEMHVLNSKALINYIYPNIDKVVPPLSYFLDHIILAPRNSDVVDLNAAILNRFQSLTVLTSSRQCSVSTLSLTTFLSNFYAQLTCRGFHLENFTSKRAVPLFYFEILHQLEAYATALDLLRIVFQSPVAD